MEWNRLWVLGRRSNVAYLRLFPNPGFMLPIWRGKRVRWSKFYGWSLTQAPTSENPYGLTPGKWQRRAQAAQARQLEGAEAFRKGQGV